MVDKTIGSDNAVRTQRDLANDNAVWADKDTVLNDRHARGAFFPSNRYILRDPYILADYGPGVDHHA